jgi:Asp/Glu/hydantoin racemase
VAVVGGRDAQADRLWAVRELTSALVIGAGEAAYRTVTLLARRFAVLTTPKRACLMDKN